MSTEETPTQHAVEFKEPQCDHNWEWDHSYERGGRIVNVYYCTKCGAENEIEIAPGK